MLNFITTEIQIKTTVKYYFTSIREARIKWQFLKKLNSGIIQPNNFTPKYISKELRREKCMLIQKLVREYS